MGALSPSLLRSLAPLCLVVFLLGPPAATFGQQVEEEDLPDSVLDEGDPVVGGLEQILAEAETLFPTPEQPESVPLLSQVIDTLERSAAAQTLSPEASEMLTHSLSLRAQARFNMGERAGAEEDLHRLITLKPEFELDRTTVSSKLLRLFDSLKDRLVGYLTLTVMPADATVWVNEQRVDLYGGSVAVLAGQHSVRAERPGYLALVKEVDVEGGGSLSLDLILDRSSAALAVVTRPSGATVAVDGEVRGTTEGVAEPGTFLTSEAARYPRQEFSTELLIEVPPGSRVLEITKEGYRPFRGKVDVTALTDYRLEPIILEAAAGTVVLHGLPDGAVVTADGNVTSPNRARAGPPELLLPPGDHRIMISKGTLGVFETTVEVADRQKQEIQVNLRPGLVLLGVLGGDEVGARNLTEGLRQELSRLENWALLDRSEEGPAVLRQAGAAVEVLRGLAERTPDSSVDWTAVQATVDREMPGAVYLLGVLSDDLLANAADLWIWPAAPGPSRPNHRRIPLDRPSAVAHLAAALSPSITAPRPSLGALLIDSNASAAPVVAHLTPGGAAELAGLRVGDELTAINGTPFFTVAQIRKLLASLEPGATVGVEAHGPDGTRTVDVQLTAYPTVVALTDPHLIYAAVSAELALELQRPESPIPNWVLQLNQAAVLLTSGAYEEAVRLLRRIQAPPGEGLGRAHLDYWLGIALGFAGPAYLGSARSAFEKSAAAPGGRLFHDEGPWVAPRARARLTALGSPGDG